MEPAPEKAEAFEPVIAEPSKDELVNVPLQDERAAEIVKPPEVAPATQAENRKAYSVLVNSVHTTLFESILHGNRKIPQAEWAKLRESLDAGGVMLVEKYDKLGWIDKYLPELCYLLATGNVVAALLEYSPKKKKKSEAEDTEDTEPEEDKRIETCELASIEDQKKAYEAKQKQQG